MIGIRQETVTGVRRTGGQFEFEITEDGDGTVPLALAGLAGSRSWYVAEKHGGLPNNGRVISAVVDLLRTGETSRLPTSLRRTRAAVSRHVSETALRRVAPQKVRWQSLSADARRRLLEPVVSPEFHGGVPDGTRAGEHERRRAPRVSARRRLEIRIVHGSIVDANARAIVLGLFRNVDPTGPAAALDARLGGAIRELALRRMFDGSLGQVYVLPTPRTALLAEFAVFAGLGDFDEFGPRCTGLCGRERHTRIRTVTDRGLRHRSVRRRVGQQRGRRARGPAPWLSRGTAASGSGARRPSHHDLRARRAQVREPAPSDGTRGGSSRRWTTSSSSSTKRNGDRRARAARRPSPSRTVQAADPVYLLVNLIEDGRGTLVCRGSLLTAGAKAAVLSGSVTVESKDLREQIARIEGTVLAPRELARAGERLARTLLAPSVRDGLAEHDHSSRWSSCTIAKHRECPGRRSASIRAGPRSRRA